MDLTSASKSPETIDLEEDEMSQHMTQSYSEISFKSDNNDDLNTEAKRPISLPCDAQLRPLNLDGHVHKEGNMITFVAEDLETKIKLSSPGSKRDSKSAPCLSRQLLDPQLQLMDAAFINDLESEAHKMATSVDNLIENLSEILHSISSITADNVDIYKNAVAKMSDSMDGNIKSMYTMMAKAEEITQNMKSVEAQSVKLKEIKKLLDLFESYI